MGTQKEDASLRRQNNQGGNSHLYILLNCCPGLWDELSVIPVVVGWDISGCGMSYKWVWDELSVMPTERALCIWLQTVECSLADNALIDIFDKRKKARRTYGAACFEYSKPVPLNTCPVWSYCSMSSWEGNPLFFHVWIKENCPKNELPARPKPGIPLVFWQTDNLCAIESIAPFSMGHLWTL